MPANNALNQKIINKIKENGKIEFWRSRGKRSNKRRVSIKKAQEVLKDDEVVDIGYGVQGPGQALNQKDNGINVIVGQRKNSKSWDKAVADGFVPGETLFEIEEALQKELLSAIF